MLTSKMGFKIAFVALLFTYFGFMRGAEIDSNKLNLQECGTGLVDAATRTQDGSSYLFQGDHFWKITQGGIAYGYPKLISEVWKGIKSGPIDAAVTWNDGSTFIFKGDEYWRFFNTNAEEGYPKKIAEGFSGIPNDIDAALVWENNGLTYFFKGDKYWRYVPKAVFPTKGNYPQNISRWHGVPDNVSAAIRWEHGNTYFFAGSEYYRYDNNAQNVPQRYPKSTADEWFECDKNVTGVIDKFEREKPDRQKIDNNYLLVEIEKLEESIKKIAFWQKEMYVELQGLDKYLKKASVVEEISDNGVSNTEPHIYT